MDHSATNGTFISPFSLKFRCHQRRGSGTFVRARGWERLEWYNYFQDMTKPLQTWTSDSCGCLFKNCIRIKSIYILTLGKEGTLAPLLTEEFLIVYAFWARDCQFSLRVWLFIEQACPVDAFPHLYPTTWIAQIGTWWVTKKEKKKKKAVNLEGCEGRH